MTLLLGDCLETMKFLASNSVDSVVTDSPYGLAFMGKRWDYDVPSVDVWREVLRVMKPGAHLLSFGGTRTYHRMVVAIEDAGFEIRDQVMWIYGSGFPKSLDVSKAIDKAAGAERPEVHDPAAHLRNKTPRAMNPNGEAERTCMFRATAPATPDAKAWSGWGTALKPANEPIVLARKPLEKGLTVAQNCLKWGTGAINVDAGRIGPRDRTEYGLTQAKRNNSNVYGADGTSADFDSTQGRWPANVLFDEEAAALLDEQSGSLRARGNKTAKDHGGKYDASSYEFGGRESGWAGDSGGASRFFYVAKASKRERNAGLEGMPEHARQRQWAQSEGRKDAGQQMSSFPQANNHPTVKPIKLMQYLVKLITPPGGVVLDPFMGSGSTGCAAKRLGFEFIGCEMSPEYMEIARRRIEHWSAEID